MGKRIAVFFTIIMLGFCFLMFRLYFLSNGDWLCEVAAQQNSYTVNISKCRGTIYDCRKKPLTGLKKSRVASVLPTINSINALKEMFSKDDFDDIMSICYSGNPFKISIPVSIKSEDINVFNVPKRYSEEPILPHIIGYLDDTSHGTSGLELAYDDYLNNCGEIFVRYSVDALGRTLSGDKEKIHDTSYMQNRGVVLSIDERLQTIAHKAAKKYLKKGAVLITEVPRCQIRACVSLPEFSPLNLEKVLDSKDAPLMNRALCAYNLGSVFKLVTSAAALEKNLSSEAEYQCEGNIMVGSSRFHCFDGRAHGPVNMEHAISKSCNSYFVDLANKLDPQYFIDMSLNFGFNKELELAPNLISDQGNLPSVSELKNPQMMANVSFGQGTLMATPIQVAGLINTIASGGIYASPNLIEGLVNEKLDYIEKHKPPKAKRVITTKTANKLSAYMKTSVEEGTSKKGKPKNVTACAKTGTAETGLMDGDRHIIQAWYAGFFPAEKPKYSIVVLAEDGAGGGESCGPVFSDIVDKIVEDMSFLLVG